jgi:hypothetical protein
VSVPIRLKPGIAATGVASLPAIKAIPPITSPMPAITFPSFTSAQDFPVGSMKFIGSLLA